MIHRGELIEKAIRESGYSITAVAQRLGKSRRWMYFLFENPNVPLDLVLQIGKILYYDFSEVIPEISPRKNSVADSHEHSNRADEIAFWKNKYYQLVDEHLEVVKQLRAYEQKGQ